MQIADLLTIDDVYLDWKVTDKADLIGKLSKLAASRVTVTDAALFDALNAREALGSTGMGGGIALPHARLASIADPVGILVRLSRAIVRI